MTGSTNSSNSPRVSRTTVSTGAAEIVEVRLGESRDFDDVVERTAEWTAVGCSVGAALEPVEHVYEFGAELGSDRVDCAAREARGSGTGGLVEIPPVRLATGRWSRWIAIAGGFGYVPIAPGTAGSFAGVLTFWLIGVGAVAAGISEANFSALYSLTVGAMLLIGTYAAGRAEIDFGRRDDGRIVIDEVVGQLIALAPLVPLLWVFEAERSVASGFFSTTRFSTGDLSVFIFEVVTGFVLFRLFDVWKPGAIRWAERRFGGGLGVMADDVVAGVYSALCLLALHEFVFERFYSGLLNVSQPEGALFSMGVPL